MKKIKLIFQLLLTCLILMSLIFVLQAEAADYYTEVILQEFDGSDNPAYIANQGRVYDANEVFEEGIYEDWEAGQNLTEEIADNEELAEAVADLESVGFYIDKVFTEEELAKFDGEERPEAYVAVENIVYDVSDVFSGGEHRGYQAGSDLSEEFDQESPHEEEMLADYKVIGLLVDKTLSPAELAEYDGEGDNDAYAAVDGLIYDMSELWPEGEHYDYFAGENLTTEITNSPHGAEVMLDVGLTAALTEMLPESTDAPVDEERGLLYYIFIGIGVLAVVGSIALGTHSFIFTLRGIDN